MNKQYIKLAHALCPRTDVGGTSRDDTAIHGEARLQLFASLEDRRHEFASFIQGRPGTPMADDSLCEVGCTYAVRGFDYHYLGLIWLDDLLWRDSRWVVQVDKVLESGITLIKSKRLANPS